MKKGFSLIEIMIAMAIIAFAFMPIIGAMSTSMKGTLKDEKIVQAMNLAQTSLNAALQFPFGTLPPLAGSGNGASATPWILGGTGQPSFAFPASGTTGLATLSLRLGQLSGNFTVALQMTDEPVSFNVPQYSAASRSADVASNPNNWNWVNYPTPTMLGVFHKYVLTVSWPDQIAGTKTYRLASFKARLVQ